MRSYRLAPQVHACATDEGAILLDVEKGAYIGLDGEQAGALSLVVERWPSSERANQPIEPSAPEERSQPRESGARELARVLCKRGLLVPATQTPAPNVSPGLPQPESELIAWCEMSLGPLRAGHVFCALRSVVTAALMLRFLRLSAIVARVRRRKDCHPGHSPPAFDIEEARKLLSVYSHIRPFLYGQKGRCLFDSLALLEFLALYGLYPSWVVAARVRPFGAHSWLQYQQFVLNGTPAYVRAYTPLLVV